MYFIDPSTGLVYEPTQDGKHLQPVPGLRVGPGFAAPSDLLSTPGPQGSDAIKPSTTEQKPAEQKKDGGASPAINQDTSKEKNVPRQK
jgi:hypothetical protein